MELSFSGIYPHLAVSSESHSEVGIGALVPWAGKLWYLTYPPHMPQGSNDKLYELDSFLQVTVRPESVGGTHACRMIHRESNQLIIGPYFIDNQRRVRAIQPVAMPGRLTAVARHLEDPANKVYFFTMESGLYEVDVHSLEVTVLHNDLNVRFKEFESGQRKLLPGKHGKGAYSGQGRLVVSNNGTGGVLAEWDGMAQADDPANWNVVDGNKYTDITGPGGIYGSPERESPIWAIGWDHKSVLLSVCDHGCWSRYRLPKGSYTHEADQGWFTEWPRIREAGEGPLLMDMFGMFFHFPREFAAGRTSGIRPLSVHHKMVVDYTEWNGQLVLACNDASLFDNRLLSRPQSNLWFGSLERLKEFGKPSGWGGPWVGDRVIAHLPSEPYLLAGFDYRAVHFFHNARESVTFTLEIDADGTGEWTEYAAVAVSAAGYGCHIVAGDTTGEWIRVKANRDISSATVYFAYSAYSSVQPDEPLFASVLPADRAVSGSAGVIRAQGDDRLSLEFAATILDEAGAAVDTAYYRIAGDMKLERTQNPAAEQALRNEAATVQEFELDRASVIMTDEQGNRYRLPKGAEAFDSPTSIGWPRGIREVVTERSLMNIHGTFYELPRHISGGLENIQPICTHNRMIFDYASWRGMFVISGNLPGGQSVGNFVSSDDGQAGLWFGNVDDLRKLGSPRGIGGPWAASAVTKNTPSDPYLMAGYRRKRAELTHNLQEPVSFRLEVKVVSTGGWGVYDTITVSPGRTFVHTFPEGYSAHWIRVAADKDCEATARFIYE